MNLPCLPSERGGERERERKRKYSDDNSLPCPHFLFLLVFLLVKFIGVGQKGTRGKRQGMLEIGGQLTRPEAEAI